ncbi:MAG: hypothetical protein EBR30_12655 [Cytophagia bacterium]|nr:hypothetical protein [Cytophagia bacterium]
MIDPERFNAAVYPLATHNNGSIANKCAKQESAKKASKTWKSVRCQVHNWTYLSDCEQIFIENFI